MAQGGAPHEDFQKLTIRPKDDTKSEDVHSHKFFLKINQTAEKIIIHCDHPQTVLEAIASKPELQEKMKSGEGKITLQKGEADKDTAIATHFPCTRLRDGELVTLIETKESVEVRDKGRFDYSVSKAIRSYVVYIKTEGGRNTKTKTLFKSNSMKKSSQLCVYGTGDMTLKDAIERDGRFVVLGDFKLEDVNKERVTVLRSDKIKHHDGQTFRISIERNTPTKANQRAAKENREIFPNEVCEAFKSTGEKDNGAETPLSIEELAAPQGAMPTPRVIPGEPAGGSEELDMIFQLLHRQYPEFEEKSWKKFLDEYLNEILPKVDFGKAQQTFNETSRIEKLLILDKSVCKIIIGDSCNGTGFVLLKRYVLTNAHLFDAVLHKNNARPDISITAVFERPNQENTTFKVSHTFIDYEKGLDYAILELVVSEDDEGSVPPGLMKHCCPMPESGEACIIGFPDGGKQKFDPTCIIEKRKRENEVKKHLQQYDDTMFTLMSVKQLIKGQDIKRIVSPLGSDYNNVASYHTYMFHGSSGSPVFDAHCRVFGLHTAGFAYGFGPTKESVIEFARPLLSIFNRFVANLRTRNNTDLLRAVEEELKDNEYQMEILTDEKPMDESLM